MAPRSERTRISQASNATWSCCGQKPRNRGSAALVGLSREHADAVIAQLVAASDLIAEALMASVVAAHGGLTSRSGSAAGAASAAAAHRAQRAVLLIPGEALEVAL